MKTVKHAWQQRSMQTSAEPVVGDCTEASHYSLCMHHVARAICVVETSPLTSSQYYMNYKVLELQCQWTLEETSGYFRMLLY